MRPMNHKKFLPQGMKTNLIKVTSYTNRNIAGFLSHPYYEEEKRFENLTQLVLLMEELQDQLQSPERSMETRVIKANGASLFDQLQTASPSPNQKVLATFKVNILFRQNASWQGNLVWMEEGVETHFRSALELVILIDSALS